MPDGDPAPTQSALRFDDAAATMRRFDTAPSAAKYATSLNDTDTHRREVRCIERGLIGVARGSRVLDLPCGTGRLLPMLLEGGYRVTAADVSSHMIDQARMFAARCNLPSDTVEFATADVLATGFDDHAFDAVVCNRLFHHFGQPDTRIAALEELARISSGPIVLSFFCALGWDGVAFHLKEVFRSKKATDRVPIRLSTFRRDVAAAGMRITDIQATRPGISRQWYVTLR